MAGNYVFISEQGNWSIFLAKKGFDVANGSIHKKNVLFQPCWRAGPIHSLERGYG